MSTMYTMPQTTMAPMQPQPIMTQSYMGGPSAFAPSTTFQPTSYQPVQVGASGTWQTTGPLPQYYMGATTIDGGYQVPANLFHDPNVINLNAPGQAGTQFVVGAPQPQVMTTQTLPAATSIVEAAPAPAPATRDVKVAKKKPKKKKSCGCC